MIKDYGKIIAKNLRRIFLENDKTQAQVSKDLNINKATLSSWMNGTRIPRMKNIDLLCHYFNCTRADIMEEPSETSWIDTLVLIVGNDKEAQRLLINTALLNSENKVIASDTINRLLAYQMEIERRKQP